MAVNTIISPKAYKDVQQIRNWYDERSMEAANRFLEELEVFIQRPQSILNITER